MKVAQKLMLIERTVMCMIFPSKSKQGSDTAVPGL